MRQWIVFLFFLLVMAGCESYDPSEASYINDITEARLAKNRDFKTSEHSPIKADKKDIFNGLAYFPVAPQWRFEGEITRPDSVVIDTILGTRAGDKRPAERYGTFHFARDGKAMSLLVYKILRSKPGYEDYLFLGFTDKTSGEETYPAGRYIDLVIEESNRYVVDFNKAYNPYCAYNPKYSCAIPPLQNDLPIAVTAGEKNYIKPVD